MRLRPELRWAVGPQSEHGLIHECTSGNTGIARAMVGAALNYGVTILMWMALVVASMAGCSTYSSSTSRVRPESVSFNHPDEIVRGQGFLVLADRRVFVVMAFLNAAGLDEEFPGKQMHPVRVCVRGLVTANLASCPEKVESWRRHYF